MAPSSSGACVCSQLRRTARKVSSLYDRALTESGLTITQHSLLVNIARAGEVGRSVLAAKLGMDRTTLTRNLKPLELARLVKAAGQSEDRRQRLLCLTKEGQRRLKRSYEQWEKIQIEFAMSLGAGELEKLRSVLQVAEAAAQRAFATA